jgi:hypothetical protein
MESLARVEEAIKKREEKLASKSSSSASTSSTPSETSPAASDAAPAADAPAPDAAVAPPADAAAAPAAFVTGGVRLNSLLRIDQELEKIRLNKKKINSLLNKDKVGGSMIVSDNSNFIPRANQQIVTVNTLSDSPTSFENKYTPISEYKQNINSQKNLNLTLYKLKNEVPLNDNLNKLLSKFI